MILQWVLIAALIFVGFCALIVAVYFFVLITIVNAIWEAGRKALQRFND